MTPDRNQRVDGDATRPGRLPHRPILPRLRSSVIPDQNGSIHNYEILADGSDTARLFLGRWSVTFIGAEDPADDKVVVVGCNAAPEGVITLFAGASVVPDFLPARDVSDRVCVERVDDDARRGFVVVGARSLTEEEPSFGN